MHEEGVKIPQPYPDLNVTEPQGVLETANLYTGGWMSILFLIGCVFVLAIIFIKKGYQMSISIATSFFLSFILGTLLWAGGMVAGKVIVLMLVLTILTTIWAFIDN